MRYLIVTLIAIGIGVSGYFVNKMQQENNKKQLSVLPKKIEKVGSQIEISIQSEMPKNNSQIVIYRPSDKIEYSWNSNVQENISYHIRLLSPNNQILADETISESKFEMRNFSLEGDYEWQVTPKVNGKFGKTFKFQHKVSHPELAFIGELDEKIKLNGIIQPDGKILFQNQAESFDIIWDKANQEEEGRILVEVSTSQSFSSLLQRTFVDQNFYSWKINQNGQYYFRVSRVSPFGNIKGQSNVMEVAVDTRYPLPQITKAKVQKKKAIIAKVKKAKPAPRQLASNKDDEAKRDLATVESKFKWNWSYLIPKDVRVSLGQGAIDFSQTSATTDATTSFGIQNLGIDLRFQETDKFYIDLNTLARQTKVKNVGDYFDASASLMVGKEWSISNTLKVFGAIGGSFNRVSIFEQNFDTDIIASQGNIFSATAEAGVEIPLGQSVLNKLKVVVDMGNLSQYGVNYTGRYLFANNSWFVDFSGGYFDGTYIYQDEFNEKNVTRNEMRFFMGIGHRFK